MGGFGTALVASLFLGWYRPEAGQASTGWEAFAALDLVLFATGSLALLVLLLTVWQRTPALPLALTSIGTFLATGASIAVLVRLLFTPDLPGAGAEDPARLAGAWIGAVATLGTLAAMFAAIRDERASSGAPPQEPPDRVRTLTLTSTGARGAGAPAPSEPEGAA